MPYAARPARLPIALDYFPSAEDLRQHVSSYYLFRADLPQVADVMRADLAQLRFMIAGRGHYSFGGGVRLPTPEVGLIGPTTASTAFAVEGPLIVFGIGLQPAGWASLVRADASLYANGVEDGVAVFGSLLDDALDALRHAHSVTEMVAIADTTMRRLILRAQDPPFWFTRMTDDWLTGDASPSVDTLIAQAGLSARQLERLAGRIYGAPPKLLARKYRALRAASLLNSQAVPWTDVMGEAFYDQSHFIREFKHFTGLTPRQLQYDPPPVMRLSLQRRELGSKIPHITMIS